jgi:hypothetical protein
MEEYFSIMEGSPKSSAFYESEKQLFDDFLEISNSKHFQHLKFLSSEHAHEVMKLRFIHKPFSFLFLVKGKNQYHLIWETLDTEEATYVWHVKKDLQAVKQGLADVKNIIDGIKTQGKRTYISSADESFSRIYHDYSNDTDGYLKWKQELQTVMA